MEFRAQLILNIEFPLAESLEEAKETYDQWLDTIAEIMPAYVSWPVVDGSEVRQLVAPVTCGSCFSVIEEDQATIEHGPKHNHRYTCENCWRSN